MTRMRAELVLLFALLAGAWLVVGNGGRSSSPGPNDAVPNGGLPGPSPVGAGLSERAEALRAYLAMPRPRVPVRRDPFSFRDSSAAAGRRDRVSSADVPIAAPAPSRPEMSLSGVAEETGNGHPVRTAVIAVSGQLVFAREGDRVLSRFVVLGISADAVQLKDGEGGEVFTLALK